MYVITGFLRSVCEGRVEWSSGGREVVKGRRDLWGEVGKGKGWERGGIPMPEHRRVQLGSIVTKSRIKIEIRIEKDGLNEGQIINTKARDGNKELN